MMHRLSALLLALGASGCTSDGPSTDTTSPPTSTTPPPSYTVGGTVAGLSNGGLTLMMRHGGVTTVVDVAEDGDFTFPLTLPDQADYVVRVVTPPACPAQVCTITDGTGVVEGGDVTDVHVECADRPDPLYRMATHSWGDGLLRLVDDMDSFNHMDAASARVVELNPPLQMSSNPFDLVAMDPVHDTLYTSSLGDVHALSGLATMSGPTDPARTFQVTGIDDKGLEINGTADMLWAAGAGWLEGYHDASTLEGDPEPAFAVNSGARSITVVNNTLYAATGFGEQAVYVYENAVGLTSASVPDRVITWDDETGPRGVTSIAVDACTDRLYLGSNWPTPAGYGLVVFEGASTLDGPVDFDHDSVAQLADQTAIGSTIDDSGTLYVVVDSAVYLSAYRDADTWSGVVPGDTNRVDISGVVNRSYGLAVAPY